MESSKKSAGSVSLPEASKALRAPCPALFLGDFQTTLGSSKKNAVMLGTCSAPKGIAPRTIASALFLGDCGRRGNRNASPRGGRRDRGETAAATEEGAGAFLVADCRVLKTALSRVASELRNSSASRQGRAGEVLRGPSFRDERSNPCWCGPANTSAVVREKSILGRLPQPTGGADTTSAPVLAQAREHQKSAARSDVLGLRSTRRRTTPPAVGREAGDRLGHHAVVL